MFKELFQQQRRYLNHFFDLFDPQEGEALLDVIINCTGIIFFTGIGKSGIAAKKIAMTMMSTGTRSLYLSPLNAMHGDLGIVTSKDVVVLLSKSGESEELLSLIPSLRNKGATAVAAVSNRSSRLAKVCDKVVYLPLEKELCPFDLAPTTSTAIQIIFGDVLAVALMHAKEFTLDDYANNHPAGSIGKKMTLQVRDLMLKGEDIPTYKPSDRLIDILVELSNKKCGCILITNPERQLQGIFTDGDLRRALQHQGSDVLQQPIEALMNREPRKTSPHLLAVEVMRKMEENKNHPIAVMPVVEESSKVIGIIKLHDIVQSGLS